MTRAIACDHPEFPCRITHNPADSGHYERVDCPRHFRCELYSQFDCLRVRPCQPTSSHGSRRQERTSEATIISSTPMCIPVPRQVLIHLADALAIRLSCTRMGDSIHEGLLRFDLRMAAQLRWRPKRSFVQLCITYTYQLCGVNMKNKRFAFFSRRWPPFSARKITVLALFPPFSLR